MSSYDDDLRFAHVLADSADDITAKRFKALDLRVETKPDLTPVTDADRAAEDSIRNILRRSRPRDAVIGEESGQTGSGPRRWVIDPIDATKNYVRGVPVWATLIGLMDGDKVVAGVATAPALGRRWWAATGSGAWTGKSLANASRCRVSGVSRLSDASFSHSGVGGWEETGRLNGFLALSRAVWRTRGFGDFWSHMLVAEGAVDISAEPEVSLWDLAALQVIVEEAGGRFTSLAGEATPDGGSVVCTNGRLHDEVLALLADSGRGALPRGRLIATAGRLSSRSIRPACARLVSPAARAQRRPARHIPRPPGRVPSPAGSAAFPAIAAIAAFARAARAGIGVPGQRGRRM